MPSPLDRRTFLKRAAQTASLGFVLPLIVACQAPQAAPPAAPAKPTEAPKAAAPAAKPAESPAAAKPAASPATAPAAPAASPAAKAAPAAPKSITKVSYGMASVNPYHIVAVVATEKPDLTRKFGVEYEMVTTTNSPNAVNALVGGSLNFASVTPDAAWAAQDKAPDVKQVLANADGTPYVIMVNPEIKAITDLKGKTLGASAVRGGADTTAIKIILAEHGLREGDYTIVQAGSVSDRTAAMKAGTIQGLAQLEPQASQLREAGFVELDNAGNYPPLKNVHSLIVISKQSWYEPNQEVAVNFVRAWMDITNWLYDPKNKDELLDIMKRTMKVGDGPAQNAYKLHIETLKVPSQPPSIDPQRIQQFAENLKRVGTENVPSDLAKYSDNSLYEKAAKA